ncbi:MAG: GxxExxY protein [Verrucomicrobiota bacterium]
MNWWSGGVQWRFLVARFRHAERSWSRETGVIREWIGYDAGRQHCLQFFAVFSGMPAAIAFVFLCDLCDSARAMKPNEITAQIVDAAYRIHTQLGPGLLETVDEVALAFELQRRGLQVRRQVPIPVEYEGVKFDEGFRADLLVEDSVIVEVKSVEKNHPVHAKQLRPHLVLAKLQVGLVLNFGLERIKEGITRIVNGLPE